MNRKAQAFGTMGIVLVTFLAVIVALALLTASFENIGTATMTKTSTNQTTTIPAAGANRILYGQTINTLQAVVNQTAGAAGQDLKSNFTTTRDTSTGVIRSAITQVSGGTMKSGDSINVSYIYEPEGYVADSGARGIVAIIAIFAALAIALVALIPTLRSGVLDMAGR